ncbi:hypothetical protein BWK69_00635 [Candidatus Parcubacteria bacterium A4]|nr:MAG: hypothetical protein BWK69_00635 [Candidatus Parcubacteria bacterium A4]
MKIIIAIDANVILSALLGGKPSVILFDSRFQFITTEFTISEVEKYLPKLAKKLEVSQEELSIILFQLPFEIYGEDFYENKKIEARRMIGEIDKKDIDILALALKFETYLWSQDKDFEKAGYSKLVKT